MTILNEEESLACIAEEASELAQAALKLRRALFCSKTNPTPVSIEEARKKIVEEFADVFVAYAMYDDHHNPGNSVFTREVDEIITMKTLRVIQRLEDANREDKEEEKEDGDYDGDEIGDLCDGDSGSDHCGNDFCDL